MTTPPRFTHRLLLGTALLGLPLASMSMVSCDKIKVPTNPADALNAAGNCPDTSSVAAIAQVDWAAEFGIDAQVGATIGGGVRAAAEIQAFAASIDAKLMTACTGLATDLGKEGTYESGEQACKAAMEAMAAIKAQFGGEFSVSLDIVPPRCRASLDAMASCVAECDASVEPGSVTVECEKGKLSGTCEAECSGRCDMSAAAKCEGTCSGSCSAKFSGSCGGECTGKCDGKKAKGVACEGKCEGSCTAMAEGSCGGNCEGSCELSGSASCNGTCTGECSAEMKAPSCEGSFEPPQASAECNAACETQVQGQVECTPASVAIKVNGAANAEAVATYVAAMQKNLPLILEVAIGMKDQALGIAASVKDVVAGVQATVGTLKGQGAAGIRLAGCVAMPFTAALQAAASIKASVDVSVEVQASCTASASAGGSASGEAAAG